MKIVCISDTHSQHESLTLPQGEWLIHAGDLTKKGKIDEIVAFNNWLGKQDFKHKIVIAGNHDFLFEKRPALAKSLITNAHYLCNESLWLEGIHIWGSPITPWFFDWAFNVHRGSPIQQYWQQIPPNVDILITHGPALGILDKTIHGLEVGCEDLRQVINATKPRYHIFGHIHEGYGMLQHEGTTFVNASVLNVKYQYTNPPLVIEI